MQITFELRSSLVLRRVYQHSFKHTCIKNPQKKRMLKTMVGGHDFIIPRAFLPNIGILKAPAKIFFYKLHKYILGVIFFFRLPMYLFYLLEYNLEIK